MLTCILALVHVLCLVESFEQYKEHGVWRSFCLAERNRLGKCGRGPYKEHLCEIISSLDQWFRCRLKHSLSTALVAI